MDGRILEIINQKIDGILESADEIAAITKSLCMQHGWEGLFAYGMAVGKLHNSFHYQCRRILERDPTPEETAEFIALIRSHESRLYGDTG